MSALRGKHLVELAKRSKIPEKNKEKIRKNLFSVIDENKKIPKNEFNIPLQQDTIATNSEKIFEIPIIPLERETIPENSEEISEIPKNGFIIPLQQETIAGNSENSKTQTISACLQGQCDKGEINGGSVPSENIQESLILGNVSNVLPEDCQTKFPNLPGTSKSFNILSSTNNECEINSEKNYNTNTAGSSTNTKKKSLRTKKQKTGAYMDYLSEDEAFLADYYGDDDSDLWEGESDSDSSSSNVSKSKQQKKQQQKQKNKKQKAVHSEQEDIVGELGNKTKKKNKNKIVKEARQSGQEYAKTDGTVVPAKKLQPNPCAGKKCGNNCESVSEERRQQIFDHSWNLSSDRRKDWIVGITQKLSVKRKRSSESDKRQFTFKYSINEGEGKRSVCLQFLSSTLDVSQKFIYYTNSNASLGSAKEDMRGKSIPPNKTTDSTKMTVNIFIKSLPAMPSHYTRKDSNRVYLPQEFKNLSNLYKIYKKKYIEQGLDVVGERVFRNIFNENFNIGFHVPKKDKCLKCLKFERLDTLDEGMQQAKLEHLAEKEHSYNRFKAHQNIYKNNAGTLCVSFDLQKVLNTPHGESMLLCYSRKLSVYNLTFYESGTRDVFCYYWDEINGKRGANEMATILHKYITLVDKRGSVTHLLLYCDCCPGQNRNRTILAMIHATLQNCTCIKTIQINYLLSGHTYMPVDSVHAVIERNTKHSIIWAPSQWYTVFETARQDPRPYKVENLTFKDFNKWDVLGEKYFRGNLTGKISKIRICTFKKGDANKIIIKNSMDDKAPSYEIEVQAKVRATPTGCYKALIPISKQKYDDLSKLCSNNVIPPLFHHEYANIPIAANIRDTLAETDLEDEDFD